MNKVGRRRLGAMKTAISLPAATYLEAEALRKRTGKTRSELYATALRTYLGLLKVKEMEARYAEGYTKHPEDPAEMEALLKLKFPYAASGS